MLEQIVNIKYISINSRDSCLVCSKEATSDVFERLWCEGVQYASCSSFNSEQCNVMANNSAILLHLELRSLTQRVETIR